MARPGSKKCHTEPILQGPELVGAKRGHEDGRKHNGRPRGSVHRYAREAIEKAKTTGDKRLPHEILLSMARGEPQIDGSNDDGTVRMVTPDMRTRAMAAQCAAPFYAPKLVMQVVTTDVRALADKTLESRFLELLGGQDASNALETHIATQTMLDSSGAEIRSQLAMTIEPE